MTGLGRALVMALALGLGAAGSADARQLSRPGSGFAALARLPDFSGGWFLKTGGQFKRGGVAGGDPPALTDEGKLRLAQADEAYFKHGVNPPLQNCLPDGMPHIMDYAFPMEFLFTPGKVTIYLEAYGQVRFIFTDGRKVPEDLPPTYNGFSVGHWEGRTLVVDTYGMVAQTQLVVSDNFLGMRHSDKLSVHERMRLIGKDLLEIQTTVDDPVIFQRPWRGVKTYERRRGAINEPREYVCSNNHEPLDEFGRQIFKFPGDEKK